MRVTQIAEMPNSRYRVFFGNETEIVLYKGELRKYHLKENEEVPDAVYELLMQEVIPKRAKLRCMNLLQTKDYTEKQLADKLRQGGYSQSCIEEAIAYVKSYGYIDDERYARSYVEYHLDTRSRKRIEMDLLKKGVAKETVREAFEALEDMGVRQDELTMICQLLEKKKYSGRNATVQEKQRIFGFLCRKGFRPDTIARALSLDITPNSV